jgi:hypothetical protein
MKRSAACIRLCALWYCLQAGCDTRVKAAPDASSACDEARQHSDLAWIQDNVFTPSCASFSSCHKGSRPAEGLSLEPGVALGNLIGRKSRIAPTETLVVPGQPEQSFLMVMLGAAGELPAGTVRMPYNSAPLCPEKLDAIARWITGLDDLPDGADAGVSDDAGTSADAGVGEDAGS